ncbi:MAG: formaldehyde-activating enzyme [Gaiellales bacterium]
MARVDELDGAIGEAWAGEVPNGSHINVVLARRGSATASAAAVALAVPDEGHAPVVVCLGAGNAVRPVTVMKNKATVESELHGLITWGAAQLGIGQGVLDAVDQGLLDAADADDVVLLVAVWVDPDAHDETACRLSAREAMLLAIADALPKDRRERITELSATRDAARNVFYSGE